MFHEDFVACRLGEHADGGAHLHITWLGAVLILVFFSALFAYRVVTACLVKRDGRLTDRTEARTPTVRESLAVAIERFVFLFGEGRRVEHVANVLA